jgi:beta-galactosidase beta subunit
VYDLTIEYIKGKENIRADFLSRNQVRENEGYNTKTDKEILIASYSSASNIVILPVLKDLASLQRSDENLSKIITAIENGNDEKNQRSNKLIDQDILFANVLFRTCKATDAKKARRPAELVK